MNTIVIYPGRFHPFHRGHKASYDYLVKRFGADNVYIATSDVQAPITSPFSFGDKQQMISKLGIPTGHVVQVKNPYQATEILDQIADPANTQVVFAVSEKDMQQHNPRFRFGVKKDGTPTKLQPMPDNPKKMKPMTDHYYVMVTPTVNFQVQGADANSASEIRNKYANGNNADRDQIVTDLYGETYPEIRDLFDKKLGLVKQTQELVAEARIKNPGRPVQLLETIKQLETRAQHLDESEPTVSENPDYIEEKWSQKYKRSINCNNPKGFSQKAHCAGRKK
jgi:hypothetical protein